MSDARRALEAGEFREAAALARRAITVNGEDAEAWHVYGAALRKLGRLAAAVSAFETAWEHEKAPEKSVAILLDAAEVLEELGRPLRAVECLAKATTERPEDVALWERRADAETRAGLDGAAFQSREEAARLRG